MRVRYAAQVTADKVVVSCPAESIRNFPILEQRNRKVCFEKEALNAASSICAAGSILKRCYRVTPTFRYGSHHRGHRDLSPARRSA